MKFFLKIILTTVLIVPLYAQYLPQTVIVKDNVKYLSNELFIKLRSNPQSGSNGSVVLPFAVARLLGEGKVLSARQLFPGGELISGSVSRIVSVSYADGVDPLILASKLKGNPQVEWAEPRYVYESAFTPNDPSYGSQWALSKVNAAAAWDISRGDTNIVIGIVDTGVDWDHPDLAANIKRNWSEIPNNNIDDDNNGYVDDFLGWDFGGLTGTADPDPMEDQPDHGTHVAGIASAVTNNATGVASLGFNCKLLAVKTCQNNYRNQSGQPYIVYGYEGIVYAAQRGAKVINCSWGGGGYSILGQEVINEATAMGALVVGAAGNDGVDELFYPASYNYVLSVASTGNTDQKSSFSNFGTAIDVSAPGSSIYNTWMDNSYANLSGTSMASPHAAGLAALVRSKFPELSPIQTAERVRATADNINSINPSYSDLMGKGRINAAAALSQGAVYSVRGHNFVLSDTEGGDGDGIFENGETISLRAFFKNYLSPVSGLTVTLTSVNANASVTVPAVTIALLGTLDSVSNQSTPFRFTIATASSNAILKFKLLFSGSGYSDFQWLQAVANPTYGNQSGNDISLTITSKGTLAFNDYPNNIQGSGFKYQQSTNMLFEGALMLATSATKVSDAARNASGGSTQNQDFTVVKPFQLMIPGDIADVEGSAVFNDNNAGASKLGVTVKLSSYSYSSAPNDKYTILRYRIFNTSPAALSGFYAGLYFDWDLVDGSGLDDYTAWDTVGALGYVYHIGGSPNTWVGAALISDTKYGYYGILNAGGDGGFQVYDGFSDAEKYQALSGGIGKARAGGGDISNVASAGPYTIPAGDSVDVAFALMGGSGITELRSIAAQARSRYQQILTPVENEEKEITGATALYPNYPNPASGVTYIKYRLNKSGFVSLKLFDLLGREVKSLVNGLQNAGSYSVELSAGELPNGVYIYELATPGYRDARKLIVVK